MTDTKKHRTIPKIVKPPINIQIVDEDGRPTRVMVDFMTLLFEKTGGAFDYISSLTLLQQSSGGAESNSSANDTKVNEKVDDMLSMMMTSSSNPLSQENINDMSSYSLPIQSTERDIDVISIMSFISSQANNTGMVISLLDDDVDTINASLYLLQQETLKIPQLFQSVENINNDIINIKQDINSLKNNVSNINTTLQDVLNRLTALENAP